LVHAGIFIREPNLRPSATQLLREANPQLNTSIKPEHIEAHQKHVETPIAESESPEPAPDTPEIPIPDMVLVQGGTFQMGEKGVAEPVHQVTLSDFEIARTTVTNAQYCAFLNEKGNQAEGGVQWINLEGGYGSEKCRIQSTDGSRFSVAPGYENHPVIYVSWFGAAAYCSWLSEKTDKNYRLPTEAEWEYAARGGSQSKGYQYAGSDDLDEVAWYSSNSGAHAHPVAEKKANELGLHDMSGNVWEWCEDWYGDYSSGGHTNPTGPKKGSAQLRRGGSWHASAARCRVLYRGYNIPGIREDNLGFRVAASVQSKDIPTSPQARSRPVMK